MDIIALKIPDVFLVTPRRFADERGWFSETWNKEKLAEVGFTADFVQDNESLSRRAGTVRGLHFQVSPSPQAKLVRVVTGAIVDVALDLREGSPTYGAWVSETLTAENGKQLFVPRGFAHGFRTMVDDTRVAYKVDGPYDRAAERGIRHDDPALGIDWGGPGTLVSEKDAALPPLAALGPVSFG